MRNQHTGKKYVHINQQVHNQKGAMFLEYRSAARSEHNQQTLVHLPADARSRNCNILGTASVGSERSHKPRDACKAKMQRFRTFWCLNAGFEAACSACSVPYPWKSEKSSYSKFQRNVAHGSLRVSDPVSKTRTLSNPESHLL